MTGLGTINCRKRTQRCREVVTCGGAEVDSTGWKPKCEYKVQRRTKKGWRNAVEFAWVHIPCNLYKLASLSSNQVPSLNQGRFVEQTLFRRTSKINSKTLEPQHTRRETLNHKTRRENLAAQEFKIPFDAGTLSFLCFFREKRGLRKHNINTSAGRPFKICNEVQSNNKRCHSFFQFAVILLYFSFPPFVRKPSTSSLFVPLQR